MDCLKPKSRPRIDLIFSDIDGTLIHKHEKTEEGNQLEADGLVHIDHNYYIDLRTIERIKQIKVSGVPVIFITSRRLSTYLNVAAYIRPNRGIVEDGCIILNEQEQFDLTWLSKLEGHIGPVSNVLTGTHEHGTLWDFMRFLELIDLEVAGIMIDDAELMASFKIVFPKEDKGAIEEDVAAYLQGNGIHVPESLKYSYNATHGSLVIIPKEAGKLNAARYVTGEFGTNFENVAALGDDYNDEELLSEVGYPLTLGTARKRIRHMVAGRKRGYVAESGGHMGTIAMLDRLLLIIKNENPRKD